MAPRIRSGGSTRRGCSQRSRARSGLGARTAGGVHSPGLGRRAGAIGHRGRSESIVAGAQLSWFRDIDDRRFGVPGALRWLGWALAAGVLLGCASPGGLGGPDGPTLPGGLSGLGGPTTARCWPSFPYRDGWLGGDAAYSIPLDAERSLWLFGDTFVGEPGQLDRRGASFIHNSIGLSHCGSDGTWAMEYHWSRDSDGVPHAFIDRGRPGAWWWLFDGFLHEGRLYIGLLEVEKSAPSGPLAMPFSVHRSPARANREPSRASFEVARGDDPAVGCHRRLSGGRDGPGWRVHVPLHVPRRRGRALPADPHPTPSRSPGRSRGGSGIGAGDPDGRRSLATGTPSRVRPGSSWPTTRRR